MRTSVAILACTVCLTSAAVAQYYPPPPPGPPPPRYERVPQPPPPPGPNAWEPGHWHWNGVQYVWVEGHYVPRRPDRYAQFVPGHWVLRDGAWIWAPAHWR